MSDYDSPWKEALEAHLEAFLGFFYPSIHSQVDWTRDPESLDGELRKLFPESATSKLFVDRLIKVWIKPEFGGDPRLLHVEFQAQRDSEFERRMYQYNNGSETHLGNHVVSIAVLGDDNSDWRPREYGYECMGFEKAMRWPVVKLLDHIGREESLLAEPNPFALLVLAHLKAKETHGNDERRAQWKERLLKYLLERTFDSVDLRRWYGILDFLLMLPAEYNRAVWRAFSEHAKEKKMPYVTWAEQEGMEKGLREGIEGMLDLKFGKAGLDLMPQVRLIDDPVRLRAFAQAIRGNTDLEGLRALLPQGKGT